MLTPPSSENQEHREKDALRQLRELGRQPLPRTSAEWHALRSPLVRERIEGEECRIVGKVFSWSPLYFDVAILVGNDVVRRKISKSSVHLAPCEHCPDFSS